MKKNLKKILASGLAVAMSVSMLTACGGGSGASDSAPAEDNTTLKFGCQMYSDGLVDPMMETNCAWNAMRYGITECLFKFNDDMTTTGCLAESCEHNDDYTEFTVTLKEGLKFSNGADVTATKVKESFERTFTEGPNGSSTPEKFLDPATKITADDAARTVKFELPASTLSFEGNLANPAMAIVDVTGTSDWEHGVIGTGPYAIESYEQLVSYSMVKNENYHDEVPYEKVEIIFMGDATAKSMALKSGEIDLTENISTAADLHEFQDDDAYEVDIAAGVRTGFAWINQKGVLANDDLRKAIIMGIDKNAICESNTIGGLYTAGYSVLPSSIDYGYDTLKDPYAYDVEAAKAMLDKAGIKDTDGNGIRELDGKDINLRYVSYENRNLNDFADAQTQYLTELGIGVTAEYGSSEDQWSKLVAFDYDLNNNNWNTIPNGDPTSYMANWYSKAEANYCGYSNPKYDELYDKLTVSLDEAERKDIITQLQQILIDDGAALIDGYYNSSMIYNKSKVGYAHIHTADYYWITNEISPAK